MAKSYKFKRTFGWYININYFNKGINPSTYDGIYYLKEDDPIQIRLILDPTDKDLLEDIRRINYWIYLRIKK